MVSFVAICTRTVDCFPVMLCCSILQFFSLCFKTDSQFVLQEFGIRGYDEIWVLVGGERIAEIG